jgi:hypothetical protein
MKVALYRSRSQARTRSSRTMPGFKQTQLGDQLLVYERGSSANQLRSAAEDVGLEERFKDRKIVKSVIDRAEDRMEEIERQQ